MITYKTVKEHFEDEILGKYTSYGIAAFSEQNGINERIKYIPDVFIDESDAKMLAEKCNCLSLDPDHLIDVIFDSI